MVILLTGASGLVGSAVAPYLASQGHQIIPLRRTRDSSNAPPCWNPEAGLITLKCSGPFEAVIHLAGESIARRWTPAAKARIRRSRIQGTQLLCKGLAEQSQLPKVLISASATGYYGNRGDELLDEQSTHGAGFLADLCQEWEAASAPLIARGVRVVHLRFGIVLTPKGGALAKMLPAFRLGLGGKVGSGAQYWSWITIDDLGRALSHVLSNEAIRGPVNVVSPHPVSNAQFTRALGKVLKRPTFLAVPAFALKLLFGEMAQEALLASTRVRPLCLEQNGFVFQDPDLEPALRRLLKSP